MDDNKEKELQKQDKEMKKQPILTPKLLGQTDDSYKAVERLAQNLDTEGVMNIGVTGPYGSGKSSVIKTLIAHDQNKHHFLELSLATLDDKEAEKDEKKIEANLLKQMIYREKKSTLPNSRFRRVQFQSKLSLVLKSIFVIIIILAFAVAYEPEFLKIDSLSYTLNLGDKNIWWDLCSVGILLIALFLLIRYLVRTYGRSKLSKLNVSDGEIELKEEDSVLSEHLAEILYFFQETEYDVVVFEDLDRFENKKIFLKLRELNYILNKSNELNRKVRFIYAVKDDMFNDSSRTKFFDYIVPIIPVMNMWNARDLLKKELEKRGFDENEISDDDMKVIAFFIDDMRILINIANEYEQYRERLDKDKDKLQANKLLAAIVYKNYYPKDFSELHNQRGKIYKCIQKKQKFASFAIEKVLGEREKLIDVRERNMHLSLKELRTVYMNHYLRHYGLQTASTINVDGTSKSPQSYIDDEKLFDKLRSATSITYRISSSFSDSTKNVNFKDVEKLASPDSYAARVSAIKNISDDIIKERAELEKEKARIIGYSLKDLIVKFDLLKEKTYLKIGLPPMADMFLSRGLIAEDYYDYMSYFYDGMITNSDRTLLLDMDKCLPLDYNRSIDKVANFVNELPDFIYSSDAILNITLVDYLASTPGWFKKEVTLIMDRLKRVGAPLDFLVVYYENGRHQDYIFSSYLEDYAEEAWTAIMGRKEEENKPSIREKLLEIWFRYCKADDINDAQKIWLNKNYSFVSKRDKIIANLETIFKRCRFEELNSGSEHLLAMAMDHASYVISAKNLSVIYCYARQMTGVGPDDITYGGLMTIDHNGFKEYLSDHINDVLKVCTNVHKGELEDTIIELLNRADIENDVLKAYLHGQVNSVTYLRDIVDGRQTMAMDCQVVKETWDNALFYYKAKGLDDSLIQFLVKNARGLSENECDQNDDSTYRFFKAVVGSEKIPFEEFSLLIKSFEFYLKAADSVVWGELEPERLKVLIDDDAFEFSDETLIEMAKTKVYGYFLIHNKEELMKVLTEIKYNTDTAKELLVSDKFSLSEKLQIVVALPDEVLDSVLADMICDLLRRQIVDIDGSKLKQLTQLATQTSNKVFFATKYVGKNTGNKDRILQVLALLPSPLNELLTSTHPMIEKSYDNEALLNLLMKCGYINYKPETKDGIEYLRPYTKSSAMG